MPTLRQRHMITETDEIERAIDAAATLWPELRDDRAALLRKLIFQGAQTVAESREVRRAQRLEAIRATSGMFTGLYPPDAAQQLREEWPE